MKHLAILGASGHGKVVADTAMQMEIWDEISFFDDKWPACKTNGIWKVIGSTSTLLESLSNYHGIVVAIGNNQIRAEKQQLLHNQHASIATVIHPKAYISPTVRVGEGSVIFANAVVNTDCLLGNGCIINTGATVDHDCKLADYVHISPGAHIAGAVSVGMRSWVGIGASIIQEVQINDDVVIGAGTAIIRDINASTTIIGAPVRPLKI